MSNDDLHLLTGAYVLDSLDDIERAAFERHLADCDACTNEVRELRETVAELGTAQHAAPPARLRENVVAEVARTAQLPPVVPAAAAPGRMRRWLAAAAVAAVAVGAFALGSVVSDRGGQDRFAAEQQLLTEVMAAPDAQLVGMEMGPGGHSSVVVSRTSGRAVIMAEGVPTPADGNVYQVWMIDRAGAKHGMSTFQPEADGEAALVVTGDLTDATAIAVTVEPPGGSAQPTSEPVGVASLA